MDTITEDLLWAVKSLLFYVETYGGEVTDGIRPAFPLYKEAIARAEKTSTDSRPLQTLAQNLWRDTCRSKKSG